MFLFSLKYTYLGTRLTECIYKVARNATRLTTFSGLFSIVLGRTQGGRVKDLNNSAYVLNESSPMKRNFYLCGRLWKAVSL